MSDHHEHLRRMAMQAANEDEDALLWALAEGERLRAECEDHKAARLAHEQTNAPLLAARAEIERLRAAIVRAKDALIDGQSTQWVHDLLVAALLEGK
jgi:hypothetical protein